MKHISIARDFSATPGARYKSDGPYSGEEFRDRFLRKELEQPNSDERIEIDLDGTAGYSTSFLEEAFGGLARLFGSESCLSRFTFKSEEEPLLVDEILEYIRDANE